MANDVTTGQALNSYQGNAALAGGEASTGLGYAQPDLKPLETMALHLYNNHLIDYNQRIKDRDHLQEMYLDPKIHVPLDKELALQLQPKLDRFKELGKKQLELTPGNPEWYEFQDLYNELMTDNAQAKTVQTLKEEHQKLEGEAVIPHEKEAHRRYLEKLQTHKVGDPIPVYNKYFGFDKNDVAVGDNDLTQTVERIVGNTRQLVQHTIKNPIGLAEKQAQLLLTNPKSATTAADAVEVYVDHRNNPSLQILNDKAKERKVLATELNRRDLLEKNKAAYDAFKVTNPLGTYQDFINSDPTLQEEDRKITEGLKYMGGPQFFGGADQPAVSYVAAKPGERLAGFTYSQDGKWRLSVPDTTVLALLGATDDALEQSKVLSEKPAIDPKDAAKLQLEAAELERKRIKDANDAELTKAKIGTEKAKQGRYATLNKKDQQTIASLTPMTYTEVPNIVGRSTLRTVPEYDEELDNEGKVISRTFKRDANGNKVKHYEFIIEGKDLPPNLAQRGGFKAPDGLQKPKANADADEIKAYNDAVEAAYQKSRDGRFRVQYYDKDGVNQTNRIVELSQGIGRDTNDKQVKIRPKTPKELSELALSQGWDIMFTDHKGNVVSTSADINRETKKEALKATTKNEEGMKDRLPVEDVEED